MLGNLRNDIKTVRVETCLFGMVESVRLGDGPAHKEREN